jgi:hypothetical protein
VDLTPGRKPAYRSPSTTRGYKLIKSMARSRS